MGGNQDAFVLKLDPANDRIVYATYLGGGGTDDGSRISVDTAGNAYVMGRTQSTTFPTVNPLQPASGGARDGDCFLAKISPAGNTLLYSTYLGGSGSEFAGANLLGPEGTVYFSIRSNSSNLPTANPFQAAGRGDFDLYIGRLNASGSQLLGATYLGGTKAESAGSSMTTDSRGNLVVVGSTISSDFPVLNPIRPPAGNIANINDGFITILAGDLRSLVFSTHYGGDSSDSFTGAVVDPSTDRIYVTGGTFSADFPKVNSIQPHGGGRDIVVVGLDLTVTPAASKAVSNATFLTIAQVFFSTTWGGIDDEEVLSSALTAGKLAVSGNTRSGDFPKINALGLDCSTGGSGGPRGGYCAVFDPATGATTFSTCLGALTDPILGITGPGNLVVAANSSDGYRGKDHRRVGRSTAGPGPEVRRRLGEFPI
ncbi:MAG: SBBP repeat-containing protein [Acidobacteriota bacterium]